MVQVADDMTLAGHQYITLILRLTLDPSGRLCQGELVDTTDSQPQRFSSRAGLDRVVEEWFSQHTSTDERAER